MSRPRVPIEQLVAEYLTGATTREIAVRHGCSFQNVAQRLRTANVALRPPMRRAQLTSRACQTCGKTYQPSHKLQRFCRTECIRIKDVCLRGHLLTEENRYHFPGSASRCRECRRLADRQYHARKRGQP